jgi:uncharacterized protein GlcG (DUF336 family)
MPDVLVQRDRVRLTLAGARVALAAAEAKAAELNVPMDIAVVDDGGHLLAFVRMDGAKLTSVEIAQNKAFTAAATGRGTHEYASMAGPGGPVFGIQASNQGRFAIYGGGVPIRYEGQLIGAVGASSGSVDQDQAVAQAGVAALLEALRAER